jgi:outer membrane receptor for ferrienterochelin and colicin
MPERQHYAPRVASLVRAWPVVRHPCSSFNPDLTSLTLRDVERVEILRGPAPVIYGATSFVG